MEINWEIVVMCFTLLMLMTGVFLCGMRIGAKKSGAPKSISGDDLVVDLQEEGDPHIYLQLHNSLNDIVSSDVVQLKVVVVK